MAKVLPRMMSTRVERVSLLEKLVSPSGLALVSYGVYLFSWVFPPDLYSKLMQEPDLMFLDWTSLVLYSLCILGFLTGLGFVRVLTPRHTPMRFARTETQYSPKLIAIPLLVGSFFCILSCVLLVRAYPNLISMLLSAEGSQIKESDAVLKVPLGLANVWLLGVLWWAMWRYSQMQVSRRSRRRLRLCFCVAFVCCILSSALQLSRGELMPVIIGSAILHVVTKLRRERLSSRFALVYGTLTCFVVIGFFLLFSALRGGDAQHVLGDVVGYTISSYNRFSAVVHRRIVYPYAGHGVYLLSFLGFNNMLNAILPFREWLQWPTFFQMWQSEFEATWNAGLNHFSIWSGAFGFIFAEIGWFAPMYLLLCGTLYGLVWRSVRRGKLLGIVLYPWFAFCVLFWFGTNYLFDNKFAVLVLDAVMLAAWEHVILRRPILPKLPDLQESTA